MNVITGKFKGRKLESIKSEQTRPTLARVKESIFCVIDSEIGGKVCLDLFAGSGAYGIECLSRGAKFVYFCDQNSECEKVIKRNLKNELDDCKIIVSDYVDALYMIKEKLDLVFLDPPYDSNFGEKALYLLAKENKLNNGATIVFEHNNKKDLQTLPKGCIISKTKNYGDVVVEFIKFEVGYGR
ncbi:MAG: 16S rRNA (guanine(966)-N(2))-methyltransferase RsmD [bacterium]|nr:16S rRNA (guanine(966)-N(2))-methyltransferase RsmD [bacterium]